MSDAIFGAVMVVGAALVLLAGVGVVRLPDVYARMHAATKASTLGIGLIGLGGAILLPEGRSKMLLAIALIFVTAPSAAHLIGRVAYRAEGVEIDVTSRDELAAMLDDEGSDPGD